MRKNTILWADDDMDDLQMMREVLLKRNEDYDIVEVHNGRDALSYLEIAAEKGILPCLIILDINMPVMDGKETLAIIKKTDTYKSVPVVVFTTSDSDLDRFFCNKLGTEMITKPPTFSTLESIVEKLLKYCNWS